MKNLIYSAAIMLTAFMLWPAHIAAFEDGGSAGSFLYEGGSGARSAGMANSCSSDSTDASGAYFNPALVTAVKNTELSFYYMSPVEDIAYDVLSFAVPVNVYGMLAFTRVELAVEGIEDITNEGIKTGDFSDKSDCYMITYGYPVTRSFSLGLTFKLVTRAFDRMYANGFGIDAGGTYNFGDVFTLSAAFLNVMAPSIKIGSAAENYPMNLRSGGALSLFDGRFMLMGDLLFINVLRDGRDFTVGSGKTFIRYSAGAELRPFDFAAVRCGVNQNGPSAGAGVTTENFTVDYAASFTALGLIHNFGVTARFGEVPTEREKKLEKEKKGLERDKEKLAEGITAMSFDQLYLSALNDYNTGAYNDAAGKVKILLEVKSGDERVKKLASDTELALNRRSAGEKYDSAVLLMIKGERVKGLAAIKEAENMSPGISAAKIQEYMDRGTKEIDARRFEEAKDCYMSVLAVDPSNGRASEMLGKIQDLINMIQKK